MGTRCHQLALYVVYENPMPMVADAPSEYQGQAGFEFIRDVPTTWEETRFLVGEPGEYRAIARRNGDARFLGGIANWTPRTIELPIDFLEAGEFDARFWTDGSLDDSRPNEIRERRQTVDANRRLRIELASGGGFVAILKRR